MAPRWAWLLLVVAETTTAAHVHDGLKEYGQHHAVRISRQTADDERLNLTVTGEAHLIELEMKVDVSHFSETYKEVHWTAATGYKVVSEGAPRCHYSGVARLDSMIGVVSANLCDDVETHAVMRFESHSLELRGFDGKHVLVDSRDLVEADPFSCGVGDKEHSEEHDHDHDDHDHGDHDHAPSFARGVPTTAHGHSHASFDEEDHGHRKLLPGDCTRDAPDKYVEVIAFNDHSRVEVFGVGAVEQNTASIFSLISSLYHADSSASSFPGIFDNDLNKCDIRVRLAGQVSFRDGNPSAVTYTTTPDSCGNCCFDSDCDECTVSETSSYCLLDTFSGYVLNDFGERDQFKSIFGDSLDNVQLLTSVDFGGSTVGLAFNGVLCSVISAGVNMARGSSLLSTATVVAHELGHNLGMGHDSTGNDGYLMAPTVQNPPATKWSDESKVDLSTFFTNWYGKISPKCAEEDPGLAVWDTPTCGDGIVDDGEECDSGLEYDTCCGSHDAGPKNACMLLGECRCANSQPCCTGGQIKLAGKLCRAMKDDQCDLEETCDGESGDCPRDLFKSPGRSCNDVSIFGVTTTQAYCYGGLCVSKVDDCSWDGRYPYPTRNNEDHGCNYAVCSTSPRSYVTYWTTPQSQDGVPCREQESAIKGGATYQCIADTTDGNIGTSYLRSVCVPSDMLKEHTWECDAWGFTSTCYDETGAESHSEYCEANAPCGTDYGTLVTPFPTASPSISPLPTAIPTEKPTPAPSPRPTLRPTRSPTGPQPTLMPVARPTKPPGVPTASPSSAAPTLSARLIYSQTLRIVNLDGGVFQENEMKKRVLGDAIAESLGLDHSSVEVTDVRPVTLTVDGFSYESASITYHASLTSANLAFKPDLEAALGGFVTSPATTLEAVIVAAVAETSQQRSEIIEASADASFEVDIDTEDTEDTSGSNSSSNRDISYVLMGAILAIGIAIFLLLSYVCCCHYKPPPEKYDVSIYTQDKNTGPSSSPEEAARTEVTIEEEEGKIISSSSK